MLKNPLAVRVAPFGVFVFLTFFQGKLGETSPYWVYLAKTIAGGILLWLAAPRIQEFKWAVSWEGCAAGLIVFIIWVGLDPLFVSIGWEDSYPKLGQTQEVWNPRQSFGAGSSLAWFYIIVRMIGSVAIVPPLEEIFYRSFLYRYFSNAKFESEPLGGIRPVPFVLTSAIFAATHREWLAALLCGFIYQGLVCWKNRLGDALTAHALTNLLLGIWVIERSQWHFW